MNIDKKFWTKISSSKIKPDYKIINKLRELCIEHEEIDFDVFCFTFLKKSFTFNIFFPEILLDKIIDKNFIRDQMEKKNIDQEDLNELIIVVINFSGFKNNLKYKDLPIIDPIWSGISILFYK